MNGPLKWDVPEIRRSFALKYTVGDDSKLSFEPVLTVVFSSFEPFNEMTVKIDRGL